MGDIGSLTSLRFFAAYMVVGFHFFKFPPESLNFNARILIILGEASFALYNFQVPLKVLFQQIYSKVFNFGETEDFIYCLSLVLSSIAIHLYREIPTNKLLKIIFVAKRKVA